VIGGHIAAVLATVARNGALRRIEGGFLIATIVEWAAWLALIVFAFDRGGPVEAGIVGFAVGAPAIVVAPTAAILGDRHPRSRVLLGAYVAQGVALLGAGIAFQSGAIGAGYGLGIVAMALVALVRPLLSSLLPEVARTPDELTAANVASGMVEGFGALAGSILAGVVLGVGGASLVLVLAAAAMAAAGALLIPIARRARRYAGEGDAAAPSLSSALRAVGHDLAAGAAAVFADRRLAVLFGMLAVTIGVLGMLSVLVIIVAMDVLGLDQDGAGYLTAVGGLGAVIGSAAATSLVGRDRLAVPLLASSVGFALAVAAMGLASEPVPVIAAVLATGIGWSFAYVAGVTLTQRLAGDDVMTRVFGIAESTQTGAEALGGLLVPLLVLAVGPSGALVVCGSVLGVVVLLAAPTLLRADRVDPAFGADLRLVRSVPMFGPLSAPVVERLAASADRATAEAGATIVREGDSGDRFFVIAVGRAEVSVGGRAAGELGPGEAFGEIALLRDVPRTATIRATVPTELVVLRRGPFLEALTGQPRSRALATDLMQEHLAADEAAR
jgi:CRP-like cAMP-binding protein/predicted MFS family arabinose efflux permease